MKKILFSIFVALVSTSLLAQEKISFITIVEDAFSEDFSMVQFKEKYKEYLTEQGDISDITICIKDVDIFGHDGTAIFSAEPEFDYIIIGFTTLFESLDNESKIHAAEACHKLMVEAFGEPNKEYFLSENVFDNPMAQSQEIKGGKTYTWAPLSGVVISDTIFETGKGSVYLIKFTTVTASFETAIQRTFFKALELGEITTKAQIANTLGVSAYSSIITENKQSAGKAFFYWDKLYFGGTEWSYAKFELVENKLAKVEFTSSELTDNKHVYDTTQKALTNKYGKPHKFDNFLYWSDHHTSITLYYFYGKSNGGDMRHYVTLEYSDLNLKAKANQIISDEL